MFPFRFGAALGVALVGASPGGAEAKSLDPQAFMPKDAIAVLQLRRPAKTLRRAEALAASAGLAPPTARSGWLLEMLSAQVPGLDAIDLSQPIWVGVAPSKAKTKGEAEPDFVVVAKVRGAATELRTGLGEDFKSIVSSGWLIGYSGGAELARPKAKAFDFPKSAETLRSMSDLVAYLDAEGLKAVAAQSEDAEFIAAVQTLDSMTFGLDLQPEGLSVLIQQHTPPDSPMAKLMSPELNTDKPLITGLPSADYAFLYGGRADPKQARLWTDSQMGEWTAMMEKVSPQLGPLARQFMTIASADEGECDHISLGAAIPAGYPSTYLVGRSHCKDPSAAWAQMPELVKIGNKALAEVAKQEGEPSPVSLALTAEPQKVGKTSLSGIKLNRTKSADLPEIVETPVLYGAADKQHLVLGWNASPEILKELIASAPSAKTPPMSAFRGSQAALLSPRLAEGYFRVGSIAAPILTQDLAPLRFILASLPPIAFSVQGQKGAGPLTQLWFPQQLAQLAAIGMQMSQQQRNPSP